MTYDEERRYLQQAKNMTDALKAILIAVTTIFVLFILLMILMGLAALSVR